LDLALCRGNGTGSSGCDPVAIGAEIEDFAVPRRAVVKGLRAPPTAIFPTPDKAVGKADQKAETTACIHSSLPDGKFNDSAFPSRCRMQYGHTSVDCSVKDGR
jgi:hypothetical protein